ncbi:Glucanosyltransferase-domain-containing protein [Cladochytrium replicatum]|nr:Glucanosyltransferase-domain-containing protein [Cladochytrium replicatum]
MILQLTLVPFICFEGVASQTQPIRTVGTRLVTAAHEVFSVRGIAYQPGGQARAAYGWDPISDDAESSWIQDLPIMESLGINVIRVYDTDPNVSHELFMKKLADHNMFLLLDLGKVFSSIHREAPAETYTKGLVERYLATVDAFQKFSNLLGFIVGNEVVNSIDTSKAAPYVKALIRDIRHHLSKAAEAQLRMTERNSSVHQTRNLTRYPIPLMVSVTDTNSLRQNEADYLLCGDTKDHREGAPDIYGINIYSWCGPTANFVSSRYKERTEQLSKYGVPMILSEYGCNAVRPRTLNEVSAIYSSPMSSAFSGGVLFEYSNEENNYGIVNIQEDKNPRDSERHAWATEQRMPIQPEFNTFRDKMRSALGEQSNDSTAVQMERERRTRLWPRCPQRSEKWLVGSVELPSSPIRRD